MYAKVSVAPEAEATGAVVDTNVVLRRVLPAPPLGMILLAFILQVPGPPISAPGREP